MARQSASGALWTVVSRATGLVRIVVTAAVLGPTYLGNLFTATNSLPNLIFYDLLLGSLVAPLLIPVVVKSLDSADVRRAERIAGGFLGAGSAVMLPMTLLLIGAGPLILHLLTVGVPERTTRAAMIETGWPLLALLLPQVVLYLVAATGAAVQNARGRFALAAGAPAVENVGAVLVLLLAALLFGSPSVEQITGAHLLLLGGGTTFAVALHAAVQWWGARHIGITLVPRAGWRDTEIREMARLARPSLGYAALSAGRWFGLLAVAGTVQGGVVALQIGAQLAALPVALFVKPLGNALLPRLSRLHIAAAGASFKSEYVQAVGLAGFFALPAAAALVALAVPLADALAFGEMLTPSGVALLAAAIAAFSGTLLGHGLFVLSTNACYARRDARGPLHAMALRALLVGLGMLASLSAAREVTVLLVLGLSTTAADLVAAFALHRRVLRALPRTVDRLWSSLLRSSLAALSMAVPVHLLATHMPLDVAKPVRFFVLACAVLFGIALYVGLQATTGSSEVTVLRRAVGRRWCAPERPVEQRRKTLHVVRTISVSVDLSTSLRRLSAWRPGTVVRRSGGRRWHGTTGPLIWACVVLAAALGSLAVVSPRASLGTAGVAALGGVVAVHPPAAAYVYLAAAPLTVGLGRGAALPVLRVNELLLLTLLAFVGVRLAWSWASRASLRLGGRLRVEPTDVCLLALLVTGSVVPLLWLPARGHALTSLDLLYGMVLWKYLLLYALVRVVIRTPARVAVCLAVIVGSSVVVAVLSMAQSMQVEPVATYLGTSFTDSGGASQLAVGRGPSTIGNSIAVGDVMAVCVAICLTASLLAPRWRRRANLLAVVFVTGGLATGQFSAMLALLITVAVVAVLTQNARRVLGWSVPASAVALLAVGPVVQTRLQEFSRGDRLPHSWEVRLENLERFFWPELFSSGNHLLGIRPTARVPDPSRASGFTWIESGHTWLLWTGGMPFLMAFLVLVAIALHRTATASRSRSSLPIAVAATASCASWVLVAVLMAFDPHLTLRGSADLIFPLLALALVPVVPPQRRRDRPFVGGPALPQPDVRQLAAVGPPLQRGAPLFVKRLLDVAVALLVLLATAPLLAIAALAVKLDDGGPVLYRAPRVGLGGRPFVMLKLRSMTAGVSDAPHRERIAVLSRASDVRPAQGSYKLEGDARVTRVGRLLRRTSLDELPQLVNVLAGDMSLVGPRPEVRYALEHYLRDDLRRFRALPGMTGLWQVSGRSTVAQRGMLALDSSYVQHWSVLLDVKILFRTPLALLRDGGAR